MKRIVLVVLVSAALASAGCDGLTGAGTKKVVVNEAVCATVAFLNLKVGEETKIVLDNTEHSERLSSLGLVLNEFPVVITSEYRPDAQVGPTFTTIPMFANAGEQDEVTVRPTYTGRYNASCQLTYTQDTGEAAMQQSLTFQIVE